MSEQTVVDTNDSATPESEGKDALADLDALLGEAKQAEEKQEPAADDVNAKLAAMEQKLSQWEEQKMQQQYRDDLNAATKAVKANLDGEVSDKVIRGLLHAEAEDNPQIREAFLSRHENPRAWDAALKVLAKSAKDELSIDRGTTEDRKAVASAMRGASETTATREETTDFKSMTDAEFAKFQSKFA